MALQHKWCANQFSHLAAAPSHGFPMGYFHLGEVRVVLVCRTASTYKSPSAAFPRALAGRIGGAA